MRTHTPRRFLLTRLICTLLMVLPTVWSTSVGAQAGRAIIPQLQEEFGLNEQQVRGALGALLVYVRARLPKPQFDELAERIPNAEQIMEEVKQRGIVTRPLDNLDEYAASLDSLGIGEATAAQFPSAVVRYLGAAGFSRERDMLARVLD